MYNIDDDNEEDDNYDGYEDMEGFVPSLVATYNITEFAIYDLNDNLVFDLMDHTTQATLTTTGQSTFNMSFDAITSWDINIFSSSKIFAFGDLTCSIFDGVFPLENNTITYLFDIAHFEICEQLDNGNFIVITGVKRNQ